MRVQCEHEWCCDAHEAEVKALRARAEGAELERDALRDEVLVLRACVSESLHGTGQTRANAYAALLAFDSRRREAAAGKVAP